MASSGKEIVEVQSLVTLEDSRIVVGGLVLILKDLTIADGVELTVEDGAEVLLL